MPPPNLVRLSTSCFEGYQNLNAQDQQKLDGLITRYTGQIHKMDEIINGPAAKAAQGPSVEPKMDTDNSVKPS